MFIASLACLIVAIVALMKRLPAQNVAFIIMSLAAVEVALEYWIKSNNLLGCVILWPGLIVLSRIGAQRLLKPWRLSPNYGLFLLGLATGETAIAQAFVGPMTTTAIEVRFCVTGICLLFLTPWFLQKRISSLEKIN